MPVATKGRPWRDGLTFWIRSTHQAPNRRAARVRSLHRLNRSGTLARDRLRTSQKARKSFQAIDRVNAAKCLGSGSVSGLDSVNSSGVYVSGDIDGDTGNGEIKEKRLNHEWDPLAAITSIVWPGYLRDQLEIEPAAAL